MQKHRPILLGVLLLAGCAVAPTPDGRHLTAFTGTWTLNVTRSTFDPGPPFRSFTLTFAPDGTRELRLVAADGKTVRASLPWSDGTPVTVAGMENTTAVSEVEGDQVDDAWTRGGTVVERVHGVVSPDGRTLTFAADGLGRPSFHNRLTFEKQ